MIFPVAKSRSWLGYGAGWSLLLLLGSGSAAPGLAAGSESFVRWMNLGNAQLENRSSAQAIASYEAALKLKPDSAQAWRNLARARMLAGEDEEALKLIEHAVALEKNSAANSYLAGLTWVHRSRFEQALPFLEAAVRFDASTAALRFQLANAYLQVRQQEKALIQLRETVRLDPLHSTAHFKLAAYFAQAGDPLEAERHQQEFMRLRKLFSDESRTPAALERCAYTQPEPAPGPAVRPQPAIKVRFSDAPSEVLPAKAIHAATAAAVLEVTTNGALHLLVVEPQGNLGLLSLGTNGKFTRIPTTPKLPSGKHFHQCIAGDFLDDLPKGVKYDPETHAQNDALLVASNGVCLLKRTGPTSFEDVTEHAGLAAATGWRAQWVDYDHDGDLDLVMATDPGLQLWQNNGDGTFTNVTAQAGLSPAGAVTDLAAADLDANVAIDLVVARGAKPTLVFMNQRAGRFARLPEPPGPWPAALRVLLDDLDNDGYLDVLLVGEKLGLILFGHRAERQQLDWSVLHEPVATLLDFDNDGWLDLCVAGVRPGQPGHGAISLWRNTGAKWTEATQAAGLEAMALLAVSDIVPGDFDGDGDTDLILVTASGLVFLRNDGGNANKQLKLRLLGTKTNPMGLGTRIEVRAGQFRAGRTLQALPVEIGLGSRTQLDSVETVWANGVADNRIAVPVQTGPETIAEKNVAAGSCPYLYAWNGRHYRFVTDLLGNSPLGLSLRRDEVLPAKPDEFVVIGTARDFRPRQGAYEVEVTEELREVLYLDHAHLVAVDHAPGVEVHSTDKLRPPPFPPSELWALHSPKPLLRALGDDGVDRTEAVRAIDGRFALAGPPLTPQWRGLCQPLTLTLDFGQVDTTSPLVLALTGWIQYGDASVNIAASQNPSLSVIAPRLEAETARGVWQPLEVVVGMPAGKNKTILCDLAGRLPQDTRRLRLITSFELRWDRIALFLRDTGAELRQYDLPPSKADLRWRGFSEIKSRAPGHPQIPDYERVSPRPPWRTTPQGWCTRYGDVLDLVKARDDRLALVNAGDALRLSFDSRALPPVPKGLVRTFFFYSDGWDKDADHNVVNGDTIEPLPVGAGGDWCLEYNTRWVEGNRFAK